MRRELLAVLLEVLYDRELLEVEIGNDPTALNAEGGNIGSSVPQYREYRLEIKPLSVIIALDFGNQRFRIDVHTVLGLQSMDQYVIQSDVAISLKRPLAPLTPRWTSHERHE